MVSLQPYHFHQLVSKEENKRNGSTCIRGSTIYMHGSHLSESPERRLTLHRNQKGKEDLPYLQIRSRW
jgi:hypothetical protein